MTPGFLMYSPPCPLFATQRGGEKYRKENISPSIRSREGDKRG